MNEDHADANADIAGRLLGGGEGVWRMLAVDVDGALFGAGEAVRRLRFSRPVASAGEVPSCTVMSLARGVMISVTGTS